MDGKSTQIFRMVQENVFYLHIIKNSYRIFTHRKKIRTFALSKTTV